MAKERHNVQIKDLVKNGRLSRKSSYRSGFVTANGERGSFELYFCNDNIYFTARIFGKETPCRDYRVSLDTTLNSLFLDLHDA